jgi:branched-subunit amino acid transport protein
MNEALLIAGMALVTFAVRYPVLALLGKIPLPEPVFRALKYVPPAVLAAIVLPAILMPNGEIDIRLSNSYLIAGIFAGIVAWRTKNLLLTIVLGMLALWAWRWLLSILMPGVV